MSSSPNFSSQIYGRNLTIRSQITRFALRFAQNNNDWHPATEPSASLPFKTFAASQTSRGLTRIGKVNMYSVPEFKNGFDLLRQYKSPPTIYTQQATKSQLCALRLRSRRSPPSFLFSLREARGMLHPLNGPNNAELTWITQCACFGSLSFVIWEGLISLNNEKRYIWPKGWCSPMFWIYIFSKYFTLAVQIHNIIQIFIFERPPLPTPADCERFYIYQACSVEVLLLAFDLVLLARVHALYDKNMHYTLIGVAAILAEFATMIISGFIVIPQVPYSSNCLVTDTPIGVVIFVVGVFFAQCVMLGMTYHRKVILLRERSGRGLKDLLTVVIRDGALVFSVMIGLILMLFVYVIFEKAIANLIYYWFSAILSTSTCRLIISTHQVNVPDRDEWDYHVHATTDICWCGQYQSSIGLEEWTRAQHTSASGSSSTSRLDS